MSKELVRLRSKMKNIGYGTFLDLCSSARRKYPHFECVVNEQVWIGVNEIDSGLFAGEKERVKFELVLQDKIVLPALESYKPKGVLLYHRISALIRKRFRKPELQVAAFIGCGYRVATTWLMAFEEGEGEAFDYLLMDAFGLYGHGKGIEENIVEGESEGVSIQEKGGAVRKAKYAELERYAVKLWRTGHFQSKRQAAPLLLSKVNEYARKNNLTPLTESSGANTIYRYLLKK